MKLPRHILAEAIAKRTIEVRDPKLLAREVAAYLLHEGRVAELESILRDIMQYRADQGVIEAEMVTAYQTKSEVQTAVKQLLKHAYPKAKSVHVGARLDENVIGGLRIDMANEQLDMTVQSKLATFKRITNTEGI